MITLLELCELLKQEDEISLLETLNISSEELVNRFVDFIEDDFDRLVEEYNEEGYE